MTRLITITATKLLATMANTAADQPTGPTGSEPWTMVWKNQTAIDVSKANRPRLNASLTALLRRTRTSATADPTSRQMITSEGLAKKRAITVGISLRE